MNDRGSVGEALRDMASPFRSGLVSELVFGVVLVLFLATIAPGIYALREAFEHHWTPALTIGLPWLLLYPMAAVWCHREGLLNLAITLGSAAALIVVCAFAFYVP